jgi:molybdopterin-guanine dinucleotide biosynthesis protein A
MDSLAARAGFVLAGGKSSRMGRDKAALPLGGRTLLEHIADAVNEAAGSVTLIGPAYPGVNIPAVPDLHPGLGPLGGIHTALMSSHAEWNLILACDLPRISAPFLTALMSAAEASGADCLIPAGPSGRLEPLCAAYRRGCRDAAGTALEHGVRKVTDGFAGLRIETWSVPESFWFQNVNTPEEWTRYLNG